MWVNCLKSLKKPSIYLLGKTPSAPSVMGWLIVGESIWIVMGGKLTMMFWGVMIAGLIMVF